MPEEYASSLFLKLYDKEDFSGLYCNVKVTINYNTTAALTVSIGSGVNPGFIIRRTSPTPTTLLSGNVSVLDVNVLLVLTLRVILGVGQVNITGDVNLNAGDVIGLFYVSSGLTVTLNLGGLSQPGVVWSMHSL